MKISKVTITDYGPCYPKGAIERIESVHPAEQFLYTDGIAFVETTDWIDARIGSSFGICYQLEVEADDGEAVNFSCYIKHPELINSATGQRFTKTVEQKNGWLDTTGFDFFTFEFEWEQFSGEWVFQIVQDERTLAEKVFRVF